MLKKKFLFASAMALYPPLLRVAEVIVSDHDLEGHVLAPEAYAVPRVYHPDGRLAQKDFNSASTPLFMHFLPVEGDNVELFGFARRAFRRLLNDIAPDYIWIHGEFWQAISHQFLRHYYFRPKPRIVAYVAVNHVPGITPLFVGRFPFLRRSRLKQILLWPRLNGVVACATKSKECARRLGLPPQVPVKVTYLPVLGPEDAEAEAISLPWPRTGSVVVGFAGNLTTQKGWKILLQALERLPENFKLVMAGDGPERQELLEWLAKPGLQGRVHYAGVLAKDQLLASYPLFDVLVLPSLTTPQSVEQFGAVLGEAMACGVPVIGSDSGAIPETIGTAGLVVPEGDSAALAQAIDLLTRDQELRFRVVAAGRQKYHNLYSIRSYARSLSDFIMTSAD